MEDRKKFDQFLSAIVILLYAVVIIIKWIMVYQDVPENAIRAVSIISTVIRCLMILVILYNACGFTENWLLRLVFIVIALFLIVSSVVVWIPSVEEKFAQWNIPSL